MDNNSHWSSIIRQVMRDLGGEVSVGDEDFLKRVEKIAIEKGKKILLILKKL